jgi:taurine--2-oxoglutarate transaminase
MELQMPTNNDQVRKADRAHVFHSWSAQSLISPLPVAGASGSWFWDFEGNRYLDLASQLINVNLGHQHPGMVAAIQEQAATLATIGPSVANHVRNEAARLIAERAPAGLEKVFFTSGGAEAVENAARMARVHTGRHKVLAAYRSYHGATAGAIALTGDPRRWDAEPGSSGTVRFWGPYLYRSPFFSQTEEEECARALEHLRQVIMMEGSDRIAALIIEPVPGSSGVLVPPPGYLQGVRELCDEFGIVMIADEVMVGFGRCGEWFAIDNWSVVPDLITFAKGVNSGYVPLGGVLISESIAATFEERAFPGGLTYSGHPLGCATAVASIGIFESEGVLANARTLGTEHIGPGLHALQAKHESVGEVRGLGAFWALELVRSRATREPLAPYVGSREAAKDMNEVLAACRAEGLWVYANANRLHVAPPCTTTGAEIDVALAVLDSALDTADRYAESR